MSRAPCASRQTPHWSAISRHGCTTSTVQLAALHDQWQRLRQDFMRRHEQIEGKLKMQFDLYSLRLFSYFVKIGLKLSNFWLLLTLWTRIYSLVQNVKIGWQSKLNNIFCFFKQVFDSGPTSCYCFRFTMRTCLVLNVAEKPSVAKEIAKHLSESRSQYVRLFNF